MICDRSARMFSDTIDRQEDKTIIIRVCVRVVLYRMYVGANKNICAEWLVII